MNWVLRVAGMRRRLLVNREVVLLLKRVVGYFIGLLGGNYLLPSSVVDAGAELADAASVQQIHPIVVMSAQNGQFHLAIGNCDVRS